MADKMLVDKCAAAAKQMRIDAVRAIYNVGNTGGHIGGTLSMIEIMSALYVGIMNISSDNLHSPERDRFILSKGHGVLAQYAALKQIGILTDEELLTFKKSGTRLPAHPSRNLDIGIEFSSGSLGQGVSLAVGTAIALKKRNNPARVYVLVGDGECDEGSVWEALASAAHFGLNNLILIVDCNHLQYDGSTEEVLSMGSLAKKFEAFGFDTCEVNGHDINALIDALGTTSRCPRAVIANTIKGKGISFMENNPLWHNGRLSEEQYKTAIKEVNMGI